MEYVPVLLCGTFGVGAPERRLVLISYRLCAAYGTFLGESVWHGIFRMSHGLYYLGDNFARLAHKDSVAYADILFADKLLIVEHRPADGGACQLNRLKNGSGGYGTRSADVYLYVNKLCFLFLGRIFVSHRPLGKL